MTKRTIKDVGLTPDQIEYLVGRSQEINPPSDFDDEVQRYLDEWTARESKNSSFYKFGGFTNRFEIEEKEIDSYRRAAHFL